ncbi:hypothetical protein GJAV_G00145930 [Gymnothorax javanicus]|nr:hypothetical protein GJAV_G00145930 [Gymnothorax javanicus]
MADDESYLCPACNDIVFDLVPLTCGHRPCQNCLTRHWERKNGHSCPLCLEESSRQLRPNALERRRPGRAALNRLCRRHNSSLMLFCPVNEKLICDSCQSGTEHYGHGHWSLHEAARKCKEYASLCTHSLKERLEGHQKAIVALNEMTSYLKNQAQHTESEIREEIKKLHCFLREEQEVRITSLKEEEEQKMQILKESRKNIERTTKEIIFDLGAMRTLEQDQEAEDLDYLQNFSSTVQRTWHSRRNPMNPSFGSFCSVVIQLFQRMKSFFTSEQIPDTISTRLFTSPLKPEPITGDLIDVAKHLGNLKCRVWERMLQEVQFTPVTLDPNTAAPCLSLSEGMTAVSYCADAPQLPDNPERFTYGAELLGSRGFTSGRHHWEVEVGNNTNWAVGVAKQSVERKHTILQGRKIERKAGILALHYKDGHYRTEMGPISIQNKLCRVRVELDCDLRRVTFFDPVRNRSLFSQELLTEKLLCWNSTEPLFPYFSSSYTAAATARAKAEAVKARLAFAEKEITIKVEKARLEATLDKLTLEKEMAAAVAEAEVLEAVADVNSECHSSEHQLLATPLSATQRTIEYVAEQAKVNEVKQSAPEGDSLSQD